MWKSESHMAPRLTQRRTRNSWFLFWLLIRRIDIPALSVGNETIQARKGICLIHFWQHLTSRCESRKGANALESFLSTKRWSQSPCFPSRIPIRSKRSNKAFKQILFVTLNNLDCFGVARVSLQGFRTDWMNVAYRQELNAPTLSLYFYHTDSSIANRATFPLVNVHYIVQ